MTKFLSELSETELNATPFQVFLHVTVRGIFPVRALEFTEVESAQDAAAERRAAGDLGAMQIEVRYFDGRVEIVNVADAAPKAEITVRPGRSGGQPCWIADGPGHYDLLSRGTPEQALADGRAYFERTRKYLPEVGAWVLRGATEVVS